MPPKVGCSKDAEIDEITGSSMSAGNWDDEFPPPDVRELGKGVYCVNDFIVGDGQRISGQQCNLCCKGRTALERQRNHQPQRPEKRGSVRAADLHADRQ